jgi:hypothetical protein
MSEFDGIKDVGGWRHKLAELIDDAKRVAAGNDDDARMSVAERLNLFIENSRPQTADISQMDDLAGKTALSLMKQTVEERMAELTVRGTELAKFTKALDAQSDALAASADSIRLTKTREVVNMLTRSVDALNQFRAAVDVDDTAGLVASVEDLLSRIQEVRNAIESGAAPKSASPRGFKAAAASPRVQKVSTRKGEKRKQA